MVLAPPQPPSPVEHFIENTDQFGEIYSYFDKLGIKSEKNIVEDNLREKHLIKSLVKRKITRRTTGARGTKFELFQSVF